MNHAIQDNRKRVELRRIARVLEVLLLISVIPVLVHGVTVLNSSTLVV